MNSSTWGERTADSLALTIRRLKPDGAFRNPFIAWKTPPPMHPIANAPPQSSTILYGHGSRAYSSIIYFCVYGSEQLE